MALTDAQKQFFKGLDLSDEQMDKIIENESLFEMEQVEGLEDLRAENTQLKSDLGESKRMYRERFFSTNPEDQNQGQNNQQQNNQQQQSNQDEKPSIENVLEELV